MLYNLTKPGHIGALHPLQVCMLRVVTHRPGIDRYSLLEFAFEIDKQRRSRHTETPKSGRTLARYLDSLESQGWLKAEEKVVPWKDGISLVKHYTVGQKRG